MATERMMERVFVDPSAGGVQNVGIFWHTDKHADKPREGWILNVVVRGREFVPTEFSFVEIDEEGLFPLRSGVPEIRQTSRPARVIVHPVKGLEEVDAFDKMILEEMLTRVFILMSGHRVLRDQPRSRPTRVPTSMRARVNPSSRRGPVVYVNVYSITREYGGPEEGGWYYTAGEPIASVRATAGTAESVAKSMRRKYVPTKQPKHWGRIVGRVQIHIEDHPAKAFPTHRPHYE